MIKRYFAAVLTRLSAHLAAFLDRLETDRRAIEQARQPSALDLSTGLASLKPPKKRRFVTDLAERVARGLPISTGISVEDDDDRSEILKKRRIARESRDYGLAAFFLDPEIAHIKNQDPLRFELAKRLLLKGLTAESTAQKTDLEVGEVVALRKVLNL